MRRRAQHGFVLIALVALLVMGALTFLVSNLSPEFMQAYRQRQTDAALVQAREALIGYALQYRDKEASQGRPDRMYGYLPLPDLGSSRNNNSGCGIGLEGCDANTPTDIIFDSNGIGPTVVGRFPWRTLGTGPLRDSNGECLWLIVSSLHSRKQQSSPPPILPPMNWDTLGQLDIVVANGKTALESALASPPASAHDRPIAIIFSPGPPLPGQDRSNAADNVTECGGNYDAKNYLDPSTTTALGGVTNYLTGSNNASGSTGDSNPGNDPDIPKSLSIQGVVQRQSDGKLWPGNCPSGASCAIAANDKGLTLTTDALFGAIRKNANFRTDINSMLDRMVGCLRDQIAAGNTVTPDALAGFTPPTDKIVGRIPSNDPCYGNTLNPLGYFSHYRDQFFLVSRITSDFTVTVDSIAQTCPAVLIFGNQRGIGQSRTTTTERNTPAYYLENLENDNLNSFTTTGPLSFAGPSLFANVSTSQTGSQDIVRCIPAGASLTNSADGNQVTSSVLTDLGLSQLSDYNAATRTLTLGAPGVVVGSANTKALFGCSWTPEAHSMGSGLRSYFKFRILDSGEGFTFAIIDGDRNGSNVCGAAQQHLGYSGNNTFTSPITYPKIGIEVDTTETTAQRSAFNPSASNTLTNGRSDPNYTGGHVAIVYWGGEAPYATGNTITSCKAPKFWSAGACYLPQEEDDNVHGLPIPPDASIRPAPRNPAAPAPPANPPAGVYKLDPGLNSIPTNQDIHVRVEMSKVVPVSLIPVRVATQSNISLTSPGNTLDGITMSSGDRVLVMAQSASADNGIYAWNGATSTMTRTTDANTVAAMLDVATQVAAGTHAATTWRQTAPIAVLGTDPITWAQYVNRYLVETWILAESNTNANQIATMKNTSRSMSQLYPGFTPHLRDSQLIYAIQGSTCPCATGQTCGSDNMCYTKAFRTVRLGFTNSQSTAAKDQVINITDFTTTWLP